MVSQIQYDAPWKLFDAYLTEYSVSQIVANSLIIFSVMLAKYQEQLCA